MTTTTEEILSVKDQVFGNANIVDSPFAKPEVKEEIKVDTPAATVETKPETVATTEVKPEIKAEEVKEEIVDANVFLEKELGYKTWDEAKAAIADYKALKEKPLTAAEIQFANDESKKIHQLLKEGKTKEVAQYLQAQELLANVDTYNDEQKLKLYIKMQNPLFDSEMIEDEFKDQYSLNEEKYKDEDGNVDHQKLRKDKVRLQQRMINDVAKAAEHFTTYRQKIELPEISAKAEPVVDESFQAYQQMVQRSETEHKQLVEQITSVPETALKYSYQFNDEANKLKVNVDYQFTKDEIAEAKKYASDYMNYLTNSYWKEDGSPLADKFILDIAKVRNLDKIVAEATNRGINEERLRYLAEKKNIGDGVVRDFGNVNADDLSEYRKQVFG